ncbi:MAG: cation transporter [Selenomonadaceae bacterium]|nr:cation transporter [Selenomonadaceae bacterium]
MLSVVKLAAGIVAQSGAMISDAIHSASDVFSTIIVMIGVKMSSKAADKEHPYGHERMECVAALILAAVLMFTGILIGYDGALKMTSSNLDDLPIPGSLALIAAIVSIIVKEAMFWYTRHYANLINSGALMADAWHHRSDAMSSVGALIGIVGARMGLPVLDPFASVVICVFICKAAVDIFKDAVDKMVDHSSSEEVEADIMDRAFSHKGVERIDLLRTREFGNRIYIELEISVNGNLPLIEAHEIAKNVHDDIETAFPKVKHIMIHVNPY